MSESMRTADSPEGWPQWLSAMRPRLHRYCSRLVGSALEGEDVVQDAVEHALAAAQAGALVQNRDAWLFRVAHNSAMDHLRRRGRAPEMVPDGPEDLAGGSPADQRAASRAALHLFMHLPVAQRAAVILMDVLGYELTEIARILDASLPATKSWLHRGRGRLRELVHEEHPLEVRPLDARERQKHLHYVELFNAHEFDAIRNLLSDDVRLEVVNAATFRGRGRVGTYFGNYARLEGWRARLGVSEGRPLLLISEQGAQGPGACVLIDWAGDRIERIRDYRHAPYLAEALELEFP